MNYQFHDKVVLRTPIRPLKTTFTEQEIRSLFSEQSTQEALWLASPNLLDEYDKWINGSITDEKRIKKLILSLQKYALRMHNRCTPFGLFAQCLAVEWGQDHTIQFSTGSFYRKTRLDMDFSCNLMLELSKLPSIQDRLFFYPNNSLYLLHNKYRYVEYHYQLNNRIHQLSAIESSVYLQLVLAHAEQGQTIQQLSNLLQSFDPELTAEETNSFILSLIEYRVLVSELSPNVTGSELLERMIKQLKTLLNDSSDEHQIQSNLTQLEQIQEFIHELDNNQFNDPKDYEKVLDLIQQTTIPFKLGKIFQTDCFSSISKGSVAIAHQKSLKNALRVLNRLTPPQSRSYLATFKQQFTDRYNDAEVPLLLALDNESGVGYGTNTNQAGTINPLIDSLVFPQQPTLDYELKWDKYQSFLLKKLINAQQNNSHNVTITLEELEHFDENWNDLPDSIAIMFQDLKDQLILTNAGGSSAVNLVGRFTMGNKDLEAIANEIVSIEDQLNPTKIIAEIVHLPENRTGNILFRSHFRKYEMPYLAHSHLPAQQQIQLSDLYISVRNDQLILSSKKWNKEVLPRLSNAHNFSFNSLPVYQFLCDFQVKDQRHGFAFDWGKLKNEFPFLPRVTVENVIVSLAKWRLKPTDFKPIQTDSSPQNTLQWREKWRLPQKVILIEGDNELVIDFSNALSVEGLADHVKNKPEIVLAEYLIKEDNLVVQNETGQAFSNEMVAFFLRKEDVALQVSNNTSTPLSLQEQSFFPPGTEWLYYKVYCGTKTADELLKDVILPFTDQLLQKQLIDGWFFIRYADSQTHIRIRFHCTDLAFISQLMTSFQEILSPFQLQQRIWNIQLDTYQRELTRYGNQTIHLVEQLFFYDSTSIVSFLGQIESDETGEQLRWLFAISSIDELLTSFQLNLSEKLLLLTHLKTSFGKEFRTNKHFNKQLDKQFRLHQQEIQTFMSLQETFDHEWGVIATIMKQRQKQLLPIIEQLLLKLHENSPHVDKYDLLGSLLHMHINRLFVTKQRAHELVIYDFMHRSYKSALAQFQATTNTSN